MPANFDDRLAAVDDALAEHADADLDASNARPNRDTQNSQGSGERQNSQGSGERQNSQGSLKRGDGPKDGTDVFADGAVGGSDPAWPGDCDTGGVVSDSREMTASGGDGESHSGGARREPQPEALQEETSKEGASKDVVSNDSALADVAALTDRVAELEAAVQALRGYAGNVRAVNDRVEERADAAVSTVDSLTDDVEQCQEALDSLQREFASLERDIESDHRRAVERRPGATVDDSWTASDRGERATGSKRAASSGSGPRSGERAHSTTADGERQCVCGRPTQGRGGVGTERVDGGERVESSDGDGTDDDRAIAWPPAEPRAPYGEIDADDDRERPGLVARLRGAL